MTVMNADFIGRANPLRSRNRARRPFAYDCYTISVMDEKRDDDFGGLDTLGGDGGEQQPYVPGGGAVKPPDEQDADAATTSEQYQEPTKAEEMDSEQEESVRSVCRLVRRYIKFDGENVAVHRSLKDAILEAIEKRDISKLSVLVFSFADSVGIEDAERLEKCRADADGAFNSLTMIDNSRIPWQLFLDQIEVAIGDALSGAMDRINRSGIIDVKGVEEDGAAAQDADAAGVQSADTGPGNEDGTTPRHRFFGWRPGRKKKG